jgi:arginase family enzyme
MLEQTVRILNFDDSLIKQKGILERYQAEIIDLSSIGPLVRLWMSLKARDQIKERLLGLSRNRITFLGSGDFHHISSVLIDQFPEDICLIIFDFHPDWDTLPPRLGCGSWVTEALRRKNIVKCISLGASSGDLSAWNIQSGNLKALEGDRLEIYPYLHTPTKVFFKEIPHNVSLKTEEGFLFQRIYWQQLKDYNLQDFFPGLIGRLPIKKVYLSIDKDCLKSEFALTNWEEGLFSLEELLFMLKLIKDNVEILGVDIVGDYSPISLRSKFKALISRLDHPKQVAAEKFPEEQILQVNTETNLRILEAIL